MGEMEFGVTVCPHCDEQRWAGTGPCTSEQCKPGGGTMTDWEDKIVVAHWPPPEPEPRPKARARPLTGLPAMMHDLMEAADRHDRLKEKP